jgi:hypothetical protein
MVKIEITIEERGLIFEITISNPQETEAFTTKNLSRARLTSLRLYGTVLVSFLQRYLLACHIKRGRTPTCD